MKTHISVYADGEEVTIAFGAGDLTTGVNMDPDVARMVATHLEFAADAAEAEQSIREWEEALQTIIRGAS